MSDHACRPGCGACCIAPAIREPFPGMPHGKPAGVRCVHLTEDLRCALFGHPDRPWCCNTFAMEPATCGADRAEALRLLTAMERDTAPE